MIIQTISGTWHLNVLDKITLLIIHTIIYAVSIYSTEIDEMQCKHVKEMWLEQTFFIHIGFIYFSSL